ncbi:hypothetical protein [Lysobacter arvi]|uniref:Uncharacterized protein n=1 Tax=Lysobacter arvi TaxID=3038776 RepID=A0ABU1CE80_9GAMM|nr:hypothetical protein [Lysobacter arvi]MDR0183445.1 hypothetical protein [Lysobacter arvi]
MDTGVEFNDAVVVATTGTGLNPEEMAPATLGYRFVLPGFSAAHSGYDWSLTAHRHSDFRKPSAGETTARVGDYVSGEVLASGSYQAPTFDKPGIALPAGKQPRWGDYDKGTTRSNSTDLKDVGRVIRGAIALVGNFKRMSIEAATLRVTYWPDRNQPELCA